MTLAKALQIVLTTTASISWFASTMIAIMILRSHNGLKSPYSRIIFGLSIADTLQSAGILASSFAAPSNSAWWGKGTVETCEAAGYFLQVGGTAVPFYTLFLSYYFLKRVKDGMNSQEFARKDEFKIHAFVWLFPIIGGFVALARKDFNPTENGSICAMLDNPVDCSTDPDTTCNRGQNAPKDSVFLITVPIILTFVMLIVNLLRFTLHVHSQERLIRLAAGRSDRDNADSSEARCSDRDIDDSDIAGCKDKLRAAFVCCCNSKQSDRQDQDTTQSLSMQSLVQSSLYILAYFLTTSGPILGTIMLVTGIPRPTWVKWLVAIFWPFGGFFNILIYTRPKVSAMRKMYPQHANTSWFVVFLLVIFSGGEVPSDNNFEVKSSSGIGNGSESEQDVNR